jgi:prepilin-type N-terminal cleavage/methylation domain-containing protein
MASHKTWATSAVRGFSLIEILTVLALLTVVGGFGVIVSMDGLGASYFTNDKDSIISTLQKARSRAISNMCFGGCTDGSAHGVHFDHVAKTYTLFQGDTYVASDPLNESFTLNPNTALSGITDAVFEKLSGSASTSPGSFLTVVDVTGRTSQIDFNSEGRISWTH